MVDSLDAIKSSRSVSGKIFPNFEMLDAKIASALNKNIQNSQLKKKVSLEEQKAQKEDRFLRGRQIAFMIYDYFRVTGAHDTVLDYADLFTVTLHDGNIQEFDTRWVKFYYVKDHPMKSWRVCTNWGYVSPRWLALFVSQNSECPSFWSPFRSEWVSLGGLGIEFSMREPDFDPFSWFDPSFLGVKKTSKCEHSKNHMNHAVDRPKMHVVWYILFQECASHLGKIALHKMHFFFQNFDPPSFLHCFLPSAARSLKRTNLCGAVGLCGECRGVWNDVLMTCFFAAMWNLRITVQKSCLPICRHTKRRRDLLGAEASGRHALHGETLLCGSHHVVRRLENTCDLGEMWLVVCGYVIKSVMCVSVQCVKTCRFVINLTPEGIFIKRRSKFVFFSP